MCYIQKKLRLISFLIALAIGPIACQNKEDKVYRQALSADRMAINEQFFDPKETPLDSNHFNGFKGLKFFPINENFKVTAQLTLLQNQSIFDLPHSHDKTRPYKNYALAKFSWEGENYALLILEQAEKKPGNENYLLLPFTDVTNGQTTYGGGRYIDLEKKANQTEITIDFNTAYNPYCAYNAKYTCPIPPKENHLPIAMEAGMKYEMNN